MTTLYVVTGFEPLQTGLAEAINRHDDFTLVGGALSLAEALEDERGALADILILDLTAVGDGGDRPTPSPWQIISGRSILLLGDFEVLASSSPNVLRELVICCDTIGCLTKDGPTSRLIDTLRLMAGGVSACQASVLKAVLGRAPPEASASPLWQGLSDRQVEILTLVARGHSNKEIAMSLSLSESTVKAHVSLVMGKLGLARRTELVRWALTNGLAVLEAAAAD